MQNGRRIGTGRTYLALGVVWVAGMAAAIPAGATTLRRIELPEMIKKADRIVHARAVEKKIYWDEAGLRIYTDTTFQVLEDAKGKGPKRLTVSMLGGRIDPVETTVEGTPDFAIGEEVVLFTSARPDGKKNLVGFSQGVMRIHEDPGSGEKVAISSVPLGVTFLQSSGGRMSIVRPTAAHAPLPSLLEEIQQIDAGSHAPGPSISKTPVRIDEKRKKP